MLMWFKSAEQKYDYFKALKRNYHWRVLDFNRHHFGGHEQVLHIERHYNKVDILNIYPQVKKIEVLTTDVKFEFSPKQFENLLTEQLEIHFVAAINDFTKNLKEHPPSGGNVSSETRGEEWLKTSLLVLERALANLTLEQRLQTTIFMGNKDQALILRIIIFNLDLTYTYHLDKKALQVTCFNKKEAAEFDYQRADFDGIFATRAYPVFDQAITLLNKISSAIIKECCR